MNAITAVILIFSLLGALGVWLSPLFEGFYKIFRLDPSIIPAMLFPTIWAVLRSPRCLQNRPK